MSETNSPVKVVYLVGAGGSHACVKRVSSPHGILMSDLSGPLSTRLRNLISDGYSDDDGLKNLVNSVIDETTDFEHVISFLDDAPSLLYRRFADEMRKAFQEVLRNQLNRIREETITDPIELYTVLLDMHNVDAFPESLEGIITTNYDEYIEAAIAEVYGTPADFGIRVGSEKKEDVGPRLLKLHGSFGWQDTWPISRGANYESTLWIPPGIQKSKQAYPFNVVWGLAREMLACDVLRIIGCRLAPNDWDLISLLFAMRHVSYPNRPRIEVIDSPSHAEYLKKEYSYLELQSLLDIEPIGRGMIAELTPFRPQPFSEYSEEDQREIISRMGRNQNWFELWLTQKVEALNQDLGTLTTDNGFVEKFMAA